ncbi:hypothetical protein BGZ94_007031 [Podila epigama]|nr:hypothetical protein BGZ94_007031 [Podila epigama]
MAKSDKAPKGAKQAQAGNQRQSSESGADNDHDHDNDHDDHDHGHDHDHDDDEHDHGHATDDTTPVKRKRLTQACDPCRKKKIKCDGIKPSCANCAKLDINCTYLPSMKKRGPRQGYIELLERRLDKMEQLLQHGPSAVDPEFLESRNLLGSRFRRGNRSASPTGDDQKADPTAARTKVDPDTRYFGTTAGYSSHHTEYDRQNDPTQAPAGPKYSSQATLPSKDRPRNPVYGIKDEIPRKDVLDHLIELYFDSLYYQMPIIHPGTFMRQYREGKVPPNLLNAICAASARFSTHPDVITTPAFLAGEPFATNLRAVLVDSIDVPTVSNVQALLFLSMYEYGAARGPRAWMFGGMAVRQAQELGLNREDSSPVFYLKGDWVMRETRRRTFWACFIMDVLASSSSGRPRMMDERDCEVLLPSEDHDWYDERPVVTEMLDDEHDSSSGTEQEHEPAPKPKPAHEHKQKPKPGQEHGDASIKRKEHTDSTNKQAASETSYYTKDQGQTLYPLDTDKGGKTMTSAQEQVHAKEGTDSLPESTAESTTTAADANQETADRKNEQKEGSANGNAEGPTSSSPKTKKHGGTGSTTLSSFAYLIRIVAVLGKVSMYVNRPRPKKSIPPNEPHSEFSVIDAALANWLKSIPPHLSYSLENGKIVKDKGEGCIIVFMHVIYHTTVVLLHRPILAADRASFPINSNFVETSVARCADAASKVSDVLEFVTAFNCPPRIFISAFFAYPVFTTATIHITNAFASDPAVAARARRSLSIHVKILQTMKSYWSMADKFFYIIRDLYSIQSKIISSAPGSGVVVPQVVSHNPHAYRKSDDVRGTQPMDLDSSGHKRHPSSSTTSSASLPTSITEDGQEHGSNQEMALERTQALEPLSSSSEGTSAPKMVVSSKLASISSFLKSDSGLIALWRRATEMQVLDEAKKEKQRLSQSEENGGQSSQSGSRLAIEQKRPPLQLSKEELEERMRMNDLEIQEINQEYERRWKGRVDPSATATDAASSLASSAPGVLNHNKTSENAPTVGFSVSEKRTKEQEGPMDRATKQARANKTASTAIKGQSKRSQTALDTSPALTTNSTDTAVTAVSSSNPGSTPPLVGSPQQQDVARPTTYRHAVILQPPQLQQRDTYIMQPIQIPPTTGPTRAGTGDSVIMGVSGAATAALTDPMTQRLANIYAQHNASQEAQAQNIEMIQNANIQQQRLRLQQQQQQHQQQQGGMSSLAFGPPGGFGTTSFMTNSSIPMQPPPQPVQQQAQASQTMNPMLGLPLVYGSSYDNGQTTSRMQTEPMNSIFDFAFPMADLSFLSSSFQMTPMMMQESTGTGTMGNPMAGNNNNSSNNITLGASGGAGIPSQAPVSSSSLGNTHPLMSPGTIATSIIEQNTNMMNNNKNSSSPTGLRGSPTTSLPQNQQQGAFNISPGLQSFLMADDAFSTPQSTPNDLIRYLQHHHQQQQQQQEMQQQPNMEPLLTQENSLIYDDYYPWSAFAPQPLPPQ